jgi:hypothetical protein
MWLFKKDKAQHFVAELYYIDGLVSTGNVNPLHNIKNNFC